MCSDAVDLFSCQVFYGFFDFEDEFACGFYVVSDGCWTWVCFDLVLGVDSGLFGLIYVFN
jgi:hypothetical protein